MMVEGSRRSATKRAFWLLREEHTSKDHLHGVTAAVLESAAWKTWFYLPFPSYSASCVLTHPHQTHKSQWKQNKIIRVQWCCFLKDSSFLVTQICRFCCLGSSPEAGCMGPEKLSGILCAEPTVRIIEIISTKPGVSPFFKTRVLWSNV